VHDDRLLFEMLTSRARSGPVVVDHPAQTRRLPRAFANFEPRRVERFDARRARLRRDAGIVRNRLKIESTVTNARAFLACSASSAPLIATCGRSSRLSRS